MYEIVLLFASISHSYDGATSEGERMRCGYGRLSLYFALQLYLVCDKQFL